MFRGDSVVSTSAGIGSSKMILIKSTPYFQSSANGNQTVLTRFSIATRKFQLYYNSMKSPKAGHDIAETVYFSTFGQI